MTPCINLINRHYYLSTISLLAAIGTFLLPSCTSTLEDISPIEEQLLLQSSASHITLDADKLKENIVTFSWTEARKVPGDAIVSYRTKLDLEGNNFGTATVIMRHEDEGILEKSFSSEQLQNWAKEKWELPLNKPFVVQFRVVAQYEGGLAFHAPEVRTISVTVQPIRTVIFDADKIFLSGSAIKGMANIEMSKTLENENQYALLLDLEEGDLEIPVAYNDETNYIAPANNQEALQDGEVVPIVMRDTPVAWKIPSAGQYRVVVNMQKATAAIYSPAKALSAKRVQWNADGGTPTTTDVHELWMHGAINGWGAPIKMDCTVSLADPQVLIYQGGRVGKTKFIVYGENDNNKNLAYAFSAPLTAAGAAQESSLTLGKPAELSGGFTSAHRNAYYTIPTGANFVVFDLRNQTILADKR